MTRSITMRKSPCNPYQLSPEEVSSRGLLVKTEAAIERAREEIDNHKAESYGFASLAAVPYAHIVAQKLEGKHPKGTTVELAPNPKDIVWANMSKSDGEKARRSTIGVLWLIFVCFFNTIPLFVISVLANLDGVSCLPLEVFRLSSDTSFFSCGNGLDSWTHGPTDRRSLLHSCLVCFPPRFLEFSVSSFQSSCVG